MKTHVCAKCCRVLSENTLAEEKSQGGFWPKVPRIVMKILGFLNIAGVCSHCMAQIPEESTLLTFDDEAENLDSIKSTPACFQYKQNEDNSYHLKYKNSEYALFIVGIIFFILGIVVALQGIIPALIFTAIGAVMAFIGFKHAFYALHANLYDDHIDVLYGLSSKGNYKRYERTNSSSADFQVTHHNVKKKNYFGIEVEVQISKCKVTIHGAEGDYDVIRNIEIGPASYLALLLNWYFKSKK